MGAKLGAFAVACYPSAPVWDDFCRRTMCAMAAALLASATARVRSERLAGTNPNGAPLYEKKVVVDGTAGSLEQRLESESADVIFMAAPAINALEQANRFVPGTRVDVARALMGDGQPPTIYSAAMMATAENSPGARAFLRALVSEEAREATTTAGFEPIAPAP